jgi:soluble epoxide hydrolase / lipid-phosphate phosphatase
MDKLERRTLTTGRLLEYAYYTSLETPPTTNKAEYALFFCHGFPDSAFLWNDVLEHLGVIAQQRKIIVPDMLGYGGTAKPLDTSMYSYDGMANDLIDILDAEHSTKAIFIGHDWGAAMVSRLYNFHPERVAGIVLLNIAYPTPTRPGAPPFNLDAANAMLTQHFSAPLWAYWDFYTASDAPDLMRQNLQKLYEAHHGDAPDWKFKLHCVPGALRAYIVGTDSVPLKPYAQQQKWRDYFFTSHEKHGFEAPVQWYRAYLKQVQYNAEIRIPLENHKVHIPVLFVGCTQDANNRVELIEIPKRNGLLPMLEVKVLECGHWSPMEMPREIAQFIGEFLRKSFEQRDDGRL